MEPTSSASEDDEFIVKSGGQCFLCLIKVEPHILNMASPFLYSLSNLSHYLNVDMKEFFSEKSSIPDPSFATEKNLKLKVELCSGCGGLTEEISELLQQLEKIQSDVNSCLDKIHSKFRFAEETGLCLADKLHDGSQNVEMNIGENLEIVRALRDEVKEKCSQSLIVSGGHHFEVEDPVPTLRGLLSEELPYSEIEIGDISIKVEAHNADLILCGNDDKDNFLDYTDVEEKLTRNSSPVMESDHQSRRNLRKRKCDICHARVSNLSTHRLIAHSTPKKIDEGEKVTAQKYLSVVETQSKSPKSIQKKPQYSINPKTGKHQCSICANEFADYNTFKAHYKSIHLKVRYKCTLCKKQFHQRSSYRHHHQSVHMGVTFNCKICNKGFGRKSNLSQHQLNTSCKVGQAPEPILHHYDCNHCGKGFTIAGNLRRHLKTVHEKLREFGCDLCGKRFQRKSHLEGHCRQVHRDKV